MAGGKCEMAESLMRHKHYINKTYDIVQYTKYLS